MIGIPLGLLYANASEWFIHKYLLHGRGRAKGGFWSFHWHDHHKAARKTDGGDAAYAENPFASWNPQSKEIAALAAGAAVHLPLLPVAPFFVGAVWFSAGRYWYLHRKSHLDIEWAKEHLTWHWDHHMGPDQDANWCVTHPFFDHVMGTRKPWLGTAEEVESRARRASHHTRRQSTASGAPDETPSSKQASAKQAA